MWNLSQEYVRFRAVASDFRVLLFGTGEGRYSKIGLKKKKKEKKRRDSGVANEKTRITDVSS
jgi:hypothetical protein